MENVHKSSNVYFLRGCVTCCTEDAEKVDTVCSFTLEIEKKDECRLFETVMGLNSEIVCHFAKAEEKVSQFRIESM